MKKLFTLIAMALLGMGSASAQDGKVELSWATMVKAEVDDGNGNKVMNAADQTNTEFYLADGMTKSGFVLTRCDGKARTQANTQRGECTEMVLNFKNNTAQKLVIPEGTSVYKINFYGWSQGDNWTYLRAYGPSDTQWEWEDKIGAGITDNDKIIGEATYPLDPCIISDEYKATDAYKTKYPNGDRAYHKPGYCFASIDFGNDPYTGQFCFIFDGNNQERAWIEVYTTREAADKAPKAEPAVVEQKEELSAGAVELSWATMVKAEVDDGNGNMVMNAADQTNTEFYLADGTTKSGFVLTRCDGKARTQANTQRGECTEMVLNFKNNTAQKLVIPEGTSVYKINFYGWSQGDNWTYLRAYGPSDTQWEWEDKIGAGITDNDKIIGEATYPLDPCIISDEYKATDAYKTKYPNGDRAYHKPGYCFASIDFGNDPYTGQFCFIFDGNNQERAWMVVYTTREAADKAPKAEPVTGDPNGISTVKAEKFSGAIFNMAGQRVDRNFKGLVIKDGKKIIVK